MFSKHKLHAGRRKWPWPSNATERGTKHVFPVNLVQILSAVPEIFDTEIRKSQTTPKRQNFAQFTAYGNYSNAASRCCDGVWCITTRSLWKCNPILFWLRRHIYIRWSDVTVICGHVTISMLWGNMAYCVKLSGEDLSRYSNKNESVLSKKASCVIVITIFLRKLSHNYKHFSELAPHHGRKTAGIDMVWRNDVTVLHPMYKLFFSSS